MEEGGNDNLTPLERDKPPLVFLPTLLHQPSLSNGRGTMANAYQGEVPTPLTLLHAGL